MKGRILLEGLQRRTARGAGATSLPGVLTTTTTTRKGCCIPFLVRSDGAGLATAATRQYTSSSATLAAGGGKRGGSGERSDGHLPPRQQPRTRGTSSTTSRRRRPPSQKRKDGSSSSSPASSSLLDEVDKIMQRAHRPSTSSSPQLTAARRRRRHPTNSTILPSDEAGSAARTSRPLTKKQSSVKLPSSQSRARLFQFDRAEVKNNPLLAGTAGRQRNQERRGDGDSDSSPPPLLAGSDNSTGNSEVRSSSSSPSSPSFLDRGLPSPEDRSLFDVFSLPAEEVERPGQSAVPPERALLGGDVDDADAAWLQYLDLLKNLEKQPKYRKQHTSSPIPEAVADPVTAWLRSGEKVDVPEDFRPSLQLSLTQDGRVVVEGDTGMKNSNNDALRRAFRSEIYRQQRNFTDKMKWSKKQHEMAKGAIYQLTNWCAKEGKGEALPILWAKSKEAGFIDRKLLQNLLYVSATFTRSRKKNARYARLTGATILDILDAVDSTKNDRDDPDTISDENMQVEDLVDRTDEIAIFHDMLYKPTEQTLSIRTRLLVAQGKGQEAEEILNECSDVELRLRAYTPILRLYLEQKNVRRALSIYKRMLRMPSICLETETYVTLISGLAENGCFQPSAPPIESAKELGYSSFSGPKLLDELLAEMAKDTMEIPMTLAKKLYNAFADGFPDSHFEKTTSLSPLKISTEAAPGDELLVNRVVVDPSTGHCAVTGTNLRLINLQEEEKVKLKEAILAMARSEEANFRKNSDTSENQKTKPKADEELLGFIDWLDKRGGKPFTAIVDGANVGYYLQNFEEGQFSFHQIQFVVETLENLGENVLVVLPFKYTRKYFYLTIGAGKKQTVTGKEKALLDHLTRAGKLFVVQPGYLDDYYWILASVSNQTNSRNGQDLNVAKGDDSGRWPGARPILVSNDQMRDHKIEMLEPLLFRRWYSNFIVNYNFTGFVGGDCPNAEIGFSAADFFSREIQGNKDPHGATVWHIPLADTDDEWLCLRIPTH